ncbi:hypothetical protein JW752_01230 [Candidatus Peregrinibacteria bacterium]|nr:hypothetical protein [Candidatus Peregrinibacteria bacterium]
MQEDMNKNHHLIRILLWIVVILGIALVGYFASHNTSLFKAELTQVGNPSNTNTTLYIPDNYTAHSPQSTDTVSVMVGGSGIGDVVLSLQAHLWYNPDDITFNANDCMSFNGTKIVSPMISRCTIVQEDADTNRLEVQIVTLTPVSTVVGDTLFKLKFSVRGGLAEGYSTDITSIWVEAKNAQAQVINTINFIGTGQITIIVDEEVDECANVDCGDYGECDPNNGNCVCEQGYGGPACGTCAAGYTGFPNCVLNVFDSLLAISLEVEEYPGEDAVTVHPTDSLGLVATGTFDDGAGGTGTQALNFRDVTWVAEPVNRLNDAALAAGRLERGDVPGMAEVFVEAQRPDDSIVRSNTISVNVPAGPIIEYARIIGSATEERGGRFNLSVKVSDADEVTDIQDMRTLIVRSGFNTYNEINSDPNKVVFSTDPFTANEVAAINAEAQEGEAQGVLQYFKVYSINVDVPENAQLTDGAYKLLLEITDTQGRLATAVLPIYIGAPATGDVSGDGQLSPLDVALAFQIANGEIQPTQNQLRAANMDGLGGVTLFDVVLLFHQVTQQN